MKSRFAVLTACLMLSACGGSSGGSGGGGSPGAGGDRIAPSGCGVSLDRKDNRSVAISVYRMKTGCGITETDAEKIASSLE